MDTRVAACYKGDLSGLFPGGILCVISFTMKKFTKLVFLLLPLAALVFAHPMPLSALETTVSPTPTYDPLVEPPLPENPTEFELGRSLYWHWCMPCHGDHGQGLTDEFRAIWEPDHQNCWERGCHGGQGLEEGFPIPTVVPGIVNETHLAHFGVVQELSSFLEKTHPPQSPGILESREYRAIAHFVFSMNGRSLIGIPAATTPTPAVTATPAPAHMPASRSFPVSVVIVAALLLIGVIFMAGKKTTFGSTDP